MKKNLMTSLALVLHFVGAPAFADNQISPGTSGSPTTVATHSSPSVTRSSSPVSSEAHVRASAPNLGQGIHSATVGTSNASARPLAPVSAPEVWSPNVGPQPLKITIVPGWAVPIGPPNVGPQRLVISPVPDWSKPVGPPEIGPRPFVITPIPDWRAPLVYPSIGPQPLVITPASNPVPSRGLPLGPLTIGPRL